MICPTFLIFNNQTLDITAKTCIAAISKMQSLLHNILFFQIISPIDRPQFHCQFYRDICLRVKDVVFTIFTHNQAHLCSGLWVAFKPLSPSVLNHLLSFMKDLRDRPIPDLSFLCHFPSNYLPYIPVCNIHLFITRCLFDQIMYTTFCFLLARYFARLQMSSFL